MPAFNGLAMRYPSRQGGQSYAMPLDIYDREGVENKWDGGRIMLRPPTEFQFLDTGTVQLTDNDDVRIYITTSDGYNSASITTSRATLLTNGFMMSKKDWRNVELTFYFVYTGGNDEGHIIMGARGGLQESPCEGFAYKAALKFTGLEGYISKQQYYPSGNQFEIFGVTKLGTSIKNKPVALKLVIYDLDTDDVPTLSKTEVKKVKIEMYGSVNGGPFRLLKTKFDNGFWNYMDICGSNGGAHGFWGGPLAFVQWSNGAQVQIKGLSIREIDATKGFSAPTTSGSVPAPTSTPAPTNSTTTVESQNDDYGVQKIYQTDTKGTHWYPPEKGLTSYDRFDDNGADIENNNDGTYTVTGKSRMLAFASKVNKDRGEDYDYPTYNFNELQKRGFWDSSKDFKNVEITMYLTCKSTSGSADEFSIVTRSVRHENEDHDGCGGSSYHGSLRFTDGAARLNKEQWHVDYTGYKTSSKKLGNILGKKVGVKFICYNSSTTSVRNEVWLDPDAKNKWTRYIEYNDTGSWGDAMKECGALKSGAAITWGSPKVVFKDNGLNIKFSKLSIRSINGKLMTALPLPTTPTGGGTGQVSRIFSKYTMVYDLIVDSSGATCSGFAGVTPTYKEHTDLTVTTITHDKPLAQSWGSEDDRKAVGWYCRTDSSKMRKKKYTRVQVYLKKKGSPAGNVEVKVLDKNMNTRLSYGTIAASSLGTSYALYTFTNDAASDSLPEGIQKGWKIAVVYTGAGSNSSNHVKVGINQDNPVDGTRTHEFQWEKEGGATEYIVLTELTDRDMCGKLFTS